MTKIKLPIERINVVGAITLYRSDIEKIVRWYFEELFEKKPNMITMNLNDPSVTVTFSEIVQTKTINTTDIQSEIAPIKNTALVDID